MNTSWLTLGTNALESGRSSLLTAILTIRCGVEIPAPPTMVVVMMDTSAAMGTRLDAIKHAVHYLIDALPDHFEFALITFSDRVRVHSGKARQQWHHAVSACAAGGVADLTGGFEAARTTVAGVRACIVLICACAQLGCGVCPHNVPVYAFSLGEQADVATLMHLARQSTGGYHEHVETATGMARTLGALVAAWKTSTGPVHISIQALPGARINRVFGLETTGAVMVPRKHNEYCVGNVITGVDRNFGIRLSVRALHEFESTQHDLARITVSGENFEIRHVWSIDRGDVMPETNEFVQEFVNMFGVTDVLRRAAGASDALNTLNLAIDAMMDPVALCALHEARDKLLQGQNLLVPASRLEFQQGTHCASVKQQREMERASNYQTISHYT